MGKRENDYAECRGETNTGKSLKKKELTCNFHPQLDFQHTHPLPPTPGPRGHPHPPTHPSQKKNIYHGFSLKGCHPLFCSPACALF